jgi:hypothetical protein
MKVEQKKKKEKTESFYILGYLLEVIIIRLWRLGIFSKIPNLSGEFGPNFSHEKSFIYM